MRHLIPALVVTIVAATAAHAAPAASPFSNKSLGEGGGYKHPDADVGQFFEVKPKPEGDKKPANPAPAKPSVAKPIPAIPAKASPAPAKAVVVKADAPAPIAKRAPAAAPAVAARKDVPAPAAAEGGLDTASADARSDYEARLLGAAPAPRRAALEEPSFSPSLEPVPSPEASREGMLFVSLELDPQEAGTLRDAVAGLGMAAAFRPDARFQPLPGAAGGVRISGWLPASRLGDAIARPGVKRVEVERGSRPAGDRRLSGEYLVKLRIADPARADESIAESVRELTAATGFAVERVLGREKIPGGGFTAFVTGTMPVSQLSRALGLSAVMKISAATAPEPAAAAPAPAAEPVRKNGFVRFVMARGLWLVLVTALLALPVVSGAVKKGLAVFVPYR